MFERCVFSLQVSRSQASLNLLSCLDTLTQLGEQASALGSDPTGEGVESGGRGGSAKSFFAKVRHV